ncbi:MAG: 4'-phosphopantetheinyl transferase superfamily protein [Muribaculaceae bacterium]|nr:4'-phosphopantetheinyl transferase superfamily protein [Muribaculaceae bacterium]
MTHPYLLFTTEISGDTSISRREREHTAVNSLLREAFGRDIEVAHTQDGAPYLEAHPDTHISISHGIDTCVLAVSSEPIGVDIETAREQLKRVAHKFLTPQEHARWSTLADETEGMLFLLMAWTAKEAVFKAALTPGLVLSEIAIDSDFTTAESRGKHYTLTYPTVSSRRAIAIAFPTGI